MPKQNSVFVDTSGWASYINQGDSLHQAAVTYCQQAATQQQGLVTTNYVIAELVALLDARLHISRPQLITIIDLIKSMRYLEIIHIDLALDDAAWALLKARPDKGWSLVDASSFEIMTTYKMTNALTTDQHFVQAGFIRLLTR